MFDDGPAVQIGSGISLARLYDQSFRAAEDIGSGTVILAGDGQILDDYALNGIASTADNLTKAPRLRA